MNLSNELVSQFVKATKDSKKSRSENTVNATVAKIDGKTYVKIDGSDQLTPVRLTTDVEENERVTVMIKDHTATVTGNTTSPAARTDTVKEIAQQIAEFDEIVAHKITVDELEAVNAVIENLKAELIKVDKLEAVTADIEKLKAKFANIEYLKATDIEAINATIENLKATFGEFTDISTESLEALFAQIDHLEGYSANFTYLSTDQLEAIKADIKELDAKKISADQLDVKYANINFANITEAAIEKLFADSGIIKDIVVSEGHITGELVGVTIRGDLITAGTLKADKLVVKGSDGLFYKLNVEAGVVESAEVAEEELQGALHGSALIARSVTAEKIRVDDLVAFDATIGGFNITNDSLYSGVKKTATNTTRGVYLDKEGQLSVGDSNNFLRYYKDKDGNYKLEIAANSLVFSSSGKNVEEFIEDSKNIEVGARNLLRNSKTLIFDKYYFQYGNPSAVLGEATLGSMKLGQE